MKNFLIFVFSIFVFLTTSFGQNSVSWYRYSAISPDGNWIVFSSQGDLYKVSSKGGTASLLTKNDAYDFSPVWSHDNKTIAFASMRYGNYDIFTIPADGGIAQRITLHSSDDIPYDFSIDNKAILFKSNRLDAASNQQFPVGGLAELYQIDINTRNIKQISTTPAEFARYSQDGNTIYFHDLKGYEDNGGNFSSDFYKQIAVAAGWGMRWDFNYFNIRFDFGYRMRDPYPTSTRYWYSLRRIREQKLGNIQVAVNYPF